MKRLQLLLVITLFTIIFTGCAAKKGLLDLRAHFTASGLTELNDEKFIVNNSMPVKLVLRAFGIKDFQMYADEQNSFILIQTKKEVELAKMIDRTMEIASGIAPLLGPEAGEISNLIGNISGSREVAAKYISVNSRFVMIHTDTNSRLEAAFNSFDPNGNSAFK